MIAADKLPTTSGKIAVYGHTNVTFSGQNQILYGFQVTCSHSFKVELLGDADKNRVLISYFFSSAVGEATLPTQLFFHGDVVFRISTYSSNEEEFTMTPFIGDAYSLFEQQFNKELEGTLSR